MGSFSDVVSRAKSVLERLNLAGLSSATTEDFDTLAELRTESLSVVGAFLATQGKTVTNAEAWVNVQAATESKLLKQAWLNADGIDRILTKSVVLEPIESAKELLSTGGVGALEDLLTEIIERPKRKTADGLPPGADWPQGIPAWAKEILTAARHYNKVNRLGE